MSFCSFLVAWCTCSCDKCLHMSCASVTWGPRTVVATSPDTRSVHPNCSCTYTVISPARAPPPTDSLTHIPLSVLCNNKLVDNTWVLFLLLTDGCGFHHLEIGGFELSGLVEKYQSYNTVNHVYHGLHVEARLLPTSPQRWTPPPYTRPVHRIPISKTWRGPTPPRTIDLVTPEGWRQKRW